MNFANSLRTSFNTSGHCFWSYLVTEKRTQVSNDIVIIVNGRKSCLEFHADLYSDICYLNQFCKLTYDNTRYIAAENFDGVIS